MNIRRTLIAVAATLLLQGAGAQGSLTNGLVAYYPFNGDATDETGNGHDGTVYGATWITNGVLGGAYSFDGGDDYIRIADHPDLNPPAFSITHWVRLSAPAVIRGSVSKGLAFTPWVFQNIFHPDSKLQFHLRVNNDNSGNLFSPFSGYFDEWTMVALTYDGTGTQMYVNGQLVAQTNFAGVQYISPADFLIGAGALDNAGVNPEHWFQGQIDEVCFYNRILLPSEVYELYSLGVPPYISIWAQPQGVVGFWGGTISIDAEAVGVPEPEYLWYKEGIPIPWATNSSLYLTNLGFDDAGTYWVVAHNSHGSVQSDSALLIVNPAGVSLGFHPFLILEGTVGKMLGIQYTTNVSPTATWVTLTNITLTQPIAKWIDESVSPTHPNTAGRFYRVVAIPDP